MSYSMLPRRLERIKTWDQIYNRDSMRWGLNASLSAKYAKSDISQDSSSLLDIGCGYGRDAIYFFNEFPKLNIYGVDSSRNAVKIYNEQLNSRPRVSIRQFDIFRGLPNDFPPIYDVVYSNYFFHLFKIKECCKILETVLSQMKKESLFISSFVSSRDRHYGKGRKLAHNLYEIQKGVPWLFFNEEIIKSLFDDSDLYISNLRHFTEIESRVMKPDIINAFYVIAKIK